MLKNIKNEIESLVKFSAPNSSRRGNVNIYNFKNNTVQYNLPSLHTALNEKKHIHGKKALQLPAFRTKIPVTQ